MAGRKDWVQADLRCLLCGRVVGRLIGPLAARDPTKRSVAGRPQFSAFRPADDAVPAVRLSGGEHFRCTTCGGAVIMDEWGICRLTGDALAALSARGGKP